jgi:hypothetical protein
LELAISISATQAIPVRVHHGKNQTGAGGNAECIAVGGVVGRIIPCVTKSHGVAVLILKPVGGFLGIIIGSNRDDNLIGSARASLRHDQGKPRTLYRKEEHGPYPQNHSQVRPSLAAVFLGQKWNCWHHHGGIWEQFKGICSNQGQDNQR